MAGLQAGDLADGLLEPGGGAARGVQEAGSRAQDRTLLASLRLQIFYSPWKITMMRIMILDILFVNMKRKYNTVGADKNGTPVFVHFSAQAASNSNISEAIM